MDVRVTRRLAVGAAILTIASILAVLPGAPSAARALKMAQAERVARDFVRQDASYRGTAAPRAPLQTRACWRTPGSRVRCSLYVVVRNACALSEGTEVCAQALWARRWLVEVRRTRHGPAARILKISSGPAAR